MTLLFESITVDRPSADCYRYLLDFSTIEQWDPGVFRARKTSPGPVDVGTLFELQLQTPAGRPSMRYELVSLIPGRQLELTGRARNFRAHDLISLSALGPDRTHIDYQAEIELAGLIGRLDAPLRPWLRRLGRNTVAGLRRALEDPTPPTQPRPLTRLGAHLLLPAMGNFTQRGYLRMSHKGLSQFMDAQTVAITGPTSGLGLACACALARLGARLLLIGRDAARLASAQQEIAAFSGRDSTHFPCYQADLASLAATRKLAQGLLEAEPRIDVLINNAGALFDQRSTSPEGHESTLALNLLAPYLLTEQLLPALRTRHGRVINVASGGQYLQALHTDDLEYRAEPFDGTKAYARCKRALVALNAFWAGEARNSTVSFFSMHPGWAATPGVARALPEFNRRLQGRLRDSRMGADTMCWLASSRALLPQHSGLFWFDRQPQPTAVLPGTAVSAKQHAALLAALRRMTGLATDQVP